MDEQQPNDQTGFRPNTGIDDAFVVLECLSSKSLEWNAPMWFASLDLTKAFDRIEYSPLFDALLQQGVPRCYCTLLWRLYKGQAGSDHGSERFNFERRVKQGDVISPILFNAGLAQEHFVCSSILVLVWDHAAVERSVNDRENLSDEHQIRSGEPQNARKQSVPTL